jgi:hypothetical protein
MKKEYYWNGIKVLEKQSLLDVEPYITISKSNFILIQELIDQKINNKKVSKNRKGNYEKAKIKQRSNSIL